LPKKTRHLSSKGGVHPQTKWLAGTFLLELSRIDEAGTESANHFETPIF
jgi:hypothetical protein